MSHWLHQAACVGSDPEQWAPEGNLTVENRLALEVCWTDCPVRAQCLEAAMVEERGLTRSYRYGIRGGLTHTERADLAKGVQPLAPDVPACQEKRGTYSGYQKHVSRRQTPCDACKAARNDYMRTSRKSRAKADPVALLADFEAAMDERIAQAERMRELARLDAQIIRCPVCDVRVLGSHNHAMEATA